jgi:hypothetical protein
MAHSKGRRFGTPAHLEVPERDPDQITTVVVYEARDSFEASAVAARLRSNGIEAGATDPFPTRVPGFMSYSVRVRKADVERAHELLAEPPEPV